MYSDREARLLENYLEELIAVGKAYRGILKERHKHQVYRKSSSASSSSWSASTRGSGDVRPQTTKGDAAVPVEGDATEDFAQHAADRRTQMRNVLEDEIEHARVMVEIPATGAAIEKTVARYPAPLPGPLVPPPSPSSDFAGVQRDESNPQRPQEKTRGKKLGPWYDYWVREDPSHTLEKFRNMKEGERTKERNRIHLLHPELAALARNRAVAALAARMPDSPETICHAPPPSVSEVASSEGDAAEAPEEAHVDVRPTAPKLPSMVGTTAPAQHLFAVPTA